MAINDKNNEIRDRIFGGDLGAEQALQNQCILYLMLRQDAIVNSMNAEQKTAYDQNMADISPYSQQVRAIAFNKFLEIQQFLEKDVSHLTGGDQQ